MSLSIRTYWVHMTNGNTEAQYRIQLSVPLGRIRIPEIGDVEYSESAKGRLDLRTNAVGIRLSGFGEGEVAWRNRVRKELRRGRRFGLPALLIHVGGVMALLVTVFGLMSRTEPPRDLDAPARMSQEDTAREEKKESPKLRRKRSLEKIPEANRSPRKSNERNPLEREAHDAFQKGDLARAAALLRDLRDQSIGGVPGRIQRLEAEVSYARCQRAYLKKNWKDALSACEEVLLLSPHSGARKILRKMAKEARALFLEGYAMEDTNPRAALQRYERVLALAPSADPYRRKALGKLKALRDVSAD